MTRLRSIFVAIALVYGSAVAAQKTIYDEKVGLYSKEHTGGVALHAHGWSVNYRYGTHLTGKKVRTYEIELAKMTHPKEYKVFNPYYENSRGYFYGKKRALYILRPSYGHKNILFDKIRKKGVEVRSVWFVGPSLGLTKPVYLEIGGPGLPYLYTTFEKYDPEKHHIDNIYGRAKGIRGLGDVGIHPGIFAKFGMSFEYSGFDSFTRAFETGVTLDAYAQQVPIMALDPNKQFFVSFYINLLYGKKYFR